MPPATSGRPRRSEQLTTDLLDMIRSGVVRPGAKLPTEAEISERFGVSRTVVREAIAQLSASGIVRAHQGRGTFVLAAPTDGPITIGTIQVDDLAGVLQLLEFRAAVEVEAAGLAARRRTNEQLGQLRTALAALADAGAPADQVEADFAFHLAVARASANPHFVSLIDSLGTGMLAIPPDRLSPDRDTDRRLHDEHAAILDAVAAGDPSWARAAMRAHLAGSAHRLSGAAG